MIESDKEWYKDLYDFRGKVEHSQIEISRFDISICQDQIFVNTPVLLDKGCTIRDYMEVTMQNVFSYSEDYIAMVLDSKCINGIRLVKVPPNNRDFSYMVYMEKDIMIE